MTILSDKILAMQDATCAELEMQHKLRGEEAVIVYAGAMIIGVANYLVRSYGSRRAYDTIQSIADIIASEEIGR